MPPRGIKMTTARVPSFIIVSLKYLAVDYYSSPPEILTTRALTFGKTYFYLFFFFSRERQLRNNHMAEWKKCHCALHLHAKRHNDKFQMQRRSLFSRSYPAPEEQQAENRTFG